MNKFEILILGKFLLTFSVLLGIPIWQLYTLRRERRRETGISDHESDLDPERG